jgi:nicotinamidase-related amidase
MAQRRKPAQIVFAYQDTDERVNTLIVTGAETDICVLSTILRPSI